MLLPTQLPLIQMQTLWKSILDPFLSRPQNATLILPNISLVSGVNVIPHQLGRVQQGWRFTDIQGTANVHRSAPFNSQTLQLTSSAAVTLSLEVF